MGWGMGRGGGGGSVHTALQDSRIPVSRRVARQPTCHSPHRPRIPCVPPMMGSLSPIPTALLSLIPTALTIAPVSIRMDKQVHFLHAKHHFTSSAPPHPRCTLPPLRLGCSGWRRWPATQTSRASPSRWTSSSCTTRTPRGRRAGRGCTAGRGRQVRAAEGACGTDHRRVNFNWCRALTHLRGEGWMLGEGA